MIDLARQKHFDLLGCIAFGLQAETVPAGREIGFVENAPAFIRGDTDLVEDPVSRSREGAQPLDQDLLEPESFLGTRGISEEKKQP